MEMRWSIEQTLKATGCSPTMFLACTVIWSSFSGNSSCSRGLGRPICFESTTDSGKDKGYVYGQRFCIHLKYVTIAFTTRFVYVVILRPPGTAWALTRKILSEMLATTVWNGLFWPKNCSVSKLVGLTYKCIKMDFKIWLFSNIQQNIIQIGSQGAEQ